MWFTVGRAFPHQLPQYPMDWAILGTSVTEVSPLSSQMTLSCVELKMKTTQQSALDITYIIKIMCVTNKID